jgi:AraC-like DNA-binding protein
VRRVKEYLKDRLAESVALADVAEHVGLSPFYLLETFRETAGLSIHQYQIQLRIAHARMLLARGMNVSRAASESGFSDQSHLGRHFKRMVDVTPGTYSAAWTAIDASHAGVSRPPHAALTRTGMMPNAD